MAQSVRATGATRARRDRKLAHRILAIDLGGTHVKVLLHGAHDERMAQSGRDFGPQDLVRTVRTLARGWRYDVIAMGYPGVVWQGRPFSDPPNLGPGWIKFDLPKAFGCPVRMINDAAMQAVGSYTGGRMLFLGLGTGLGSALILDGAIEATELGHLPYRKGRSYESWLGKQGLKRLGRKKWERAVFDVTERLREAFIVEYVVIGGGNAKKLKALPPGARLGDNNNAFKGAFALWLDSRWADAVSFSKQRTGHPTARPR
jgi:predicted NBD/HSP70 family sugar kinase